MRKVVRNLTLKRRFVRVCLPGAMSLEFRSKDGTLPGRGVFPRRAKCALSRSSVTLAPLNGRASILWRKPFRSPRARALFARARVTLKVRDGKKRLIERLHSKSLIHRVEDSLIENVRVSCMPGELVPIPESVSDLFRNVGDFALVGKYCAVYMALCVVRIIVQVLSLVQDSFLGVMKIVPCLGLNP